MNDVRQTFFFGIAAGALALSLSGGAAAGKPEVIDSDSSVTLDDNELTHLVFMREEEKLARDVYIVLGEMYPEAGIFGDIDDSEQRHTDTVRDTILSYDEKDPTKRDNVGVYTGKEYGWYFTEKFAQLTEMGARSELDALYVGAFIEELDMLDITQCPAIIVEMDDDIDEVTDCGKVYTDNLDLQRMYDSLLEGSKNHLRAYVGNIEAVIGEGNYEAQVLSQEEVDAILGRL